MPLSISKPTGNYVGGVVEIATYWAIERIFVDNINQKVQLTVVGYDSQATKLARPSSFIAQHIVTFPSANSSQYPFDPTYMAANFNAAGTNAFLAAAQALCLTDPFFSGATEVS